MDRQGKSPPGVRLQWAATVAVVLVVLVIWFLQDRSPDRGPVERSPARPAESFAPASGGSLEDRPAADPVLGPEAPMRTTRPVKENREAEPDDSSSNEARGALRDAANGVKVSPAGLRYSPGGPEGHRLDHVLRHAADLPDRPGVHGVFDGGPDEILAVIDEAYTLARQGGRRVRTTREERRTIHEVNMGRRIGFVGGQSGGRQGHPAADHVRLVLEGNNVITAFPFRP